MVSPVGNAAIRDRLRTALHAALRARDKTAASALRSALAAIDNISAVPAAPTPGVASGPHFAGAPAGLGAGERPRRGLTDGEAERIVRAEIERYPGVHLDTTMAFTGFMERLAPFPPALRPRLAAAAGRILLGSDFPNIPYPYLDQLEALDRLDLGAAWLRAVCHDNAVRLLGL
jgi:amidohydrolase family protein